ncbi:MAG: hypothetical protein ACOCVG_00435 [Verrucomicrobiota bacterium]
MAELLICLFPLFGRALYLREGRAMPWLRLLRKLVVETLPLLFFMPGLVWLIALVLLFASNYATKLLCDASAKGREKNLWHLGVLLITLFGLYQLAGLLQPSPLADLLSPLPSLPLVGLFWVFLGANESNRVVRAVLLSLERKPLMEESQRGRIIGILERIFVMAAVVSQQYTVLGFVIAAKGLARFEKLKESDFAEYFLIGTMLSVLAGGLVALLAMASYGTLFSP